MSLTPSNTYTSWKDWLIAAMFGLLMILGGFAFDGVNKTFIALDKRISSDEVRVKDIELALPTRAERIRALEIRGDSTEKKLDDINAKLDRLLMMHMAK